MASRKRRSFSRLTGTSRYRAIFLVAFEGSKTEMAYFRRLNEQVDNIHVDLIRSDKKSAPQYVLNRMRDKLGLKQLGARDQAWLVLDKDQWSESQFVELQAWADEDHRYRLAVSNPKFEYWILLHFEGGAGIKTERDFVARLKKHLPAYEKNADFSGIGLTDISAAVDRAKKRDTSPADDWPSEKWQTRVYQLIESVLDESKG